MEHDVGDFLKALLEVKTEDTLKKKGEWFNDSSHFKQAVDELTAAKESFSFCPNDGLKGATTDQIVREYDRTHPSGTRFKWQVSVLVCWVPWAATVCQ